MAKETRKQVKTAKAPIRVELVSLLTASDQIMKTTRYTTPGFTNVIANWGISGYQFRSQPNRTVKINMLTTNIAEKTALARQIRRPRGPSNHNPTFSVSRSR